MNDLTLRELLIPLLMLFVSTPIFSQIVNVESLRKRTDTTGFAGGTALTGSYLDNKKVIYTISFEPNVQYKSKKDLFLMTGDYKITKSDSEAYQNAAFLHFRHNRKFTDRFRWESFTQIQDNKISKLKYRFLVGTGPRIKVIGKENIRLYLGFIPMYEHEQIDNEEQTINDNFRLSQYLSVTITIGEQAEFYSTSYYQPVFSKFKDYRFFSEQKLKIKLVGNLSFTFSGVYTWDNHPPEDAPARTLQMKTGLQYDF